MVDGYKVYRWAFAAFLVVGFAAITYNSVRMAVGTRANQAAPIVEYQVRVIQDRWTWDPDRIEAPVGAVVRLTVTNDDAYDHGFAINDLYVDYRLPAQSTTTVEFVAPRAGEFRFRCSVYCGSGHFEQLGTLVVFEADVAANRDAVATRVAAAGGTLASGSTAARASTVGATHTGASAVRVAADDTANLPQRSHLDRVDRLSYTVEDGVKVFNLTAQEFMWDYGNGEPIRSWGYNMQLPGPEIRVVEGDRVRVHVNNELPVATTVHWHGIDLNNRMDGVPGYTQPAIAPGERFTYEFTAYPAGTRFYHTHGSHHGDEAVQLDRGLAGAFVVLPRDYQAPDIDVSWVLTERIQHGLFPINGAVYPETEFIRVNTGDRVRVRLINAGSATFHPMHLHGHQFRVVSTDGNPVPLAAQLTRNTLPVLPGETYDIEFVADNPGLWLFHCHELNHAAGGMISAVIYNDFIGGDYELIDPAGRTVRNTDFQGRHTLVTFGYTNCADACPVTLGTLGTVLDALGDAADRLQPLFVSVDPARDTPERMGAYVGAFDPRIMGLTGSQAQIEQVTAAFQTEYRYVPYADGSSYSVDHPSRFYLMGPDGAYITHFDHHEDVNRMIDVLRRQLQTEEGA